MNKNDYKKFVLAGDIGATNLTLAVIGVNKGFDIILTSKYKTEEHKNLIEPVNQTLKKAYEMHGIEINTASFGLAGTLPDDRKKAKLNNADLWVDVYELFGKTMLGKIALMNDLEAIGYSLDVLPKDCVEQIPIIAKRKKILAKPESNGAKAILAPGTGLGVGVIPCSGERYIVMPSEGGQISFSAITDLDWKLAKFLIKNKRMRDHTFPINESVLSGFGLENIYDFLKTQKFKSKFEKEVNSSPDRAALISLYSRQDKRCEAAIDLFFRYCGRAAADLAMLTLSTAGLYIGGGIPIKNIDKLKTSCFVKGFTETMGKGLRSRVLPRVPVFVINTYNANLYGAANVAVNFMKELGHQRK